jgi:hypothetical protein
VQRSDHHQIVVTIVEQRLDLAHPAAIALGGQRPIQVRIFLEALCQQRRG